MDGSHFPDFEIDDAGLRVSVQLALGNSRTFSVLHRVNHATASALGTSWRVRVFFRRRLSEFRDNWLSKNQGVLKAAKTFQRHFLKV